MSESAEPGTFGSSSGRDVLGREGDIVESAILMVSRGREEGDVGLVVAADSEES
jgi:hypothetical protein